MRFQSIDYLVFLVLVVCLYWILPKARYRNLLVLAASNLFYGYVHPWFLVLLWCVVLATHLCAVELERSRYTRPWLVAGVASNLAVLIGFKYFGFFSSRLSGVLAHLGLSTSENTLALILPVGISFYTLQAIGYLADVAAKRVRADPSLLNVAVFISFFPQLVAGPIERASSLLDQVQKGASFDPVEFRSGILLILWGLFQKLVVADNVAVVSDRLFSLSDPTWPLAWTGVLAFGVQILADFSAYTDIARGSARLLGFELCKNFEHPYLSRGPKEFWRRWHISLSTWFRDYVYKPLGGNRVPGYRWVANIVVVFALSGMWHGAGANFFVWGLYWAAAYLAGHAIGKTLAWIAGARWSLPFRIGLNLVVVFVGWLFFREHDLSWAMHLLSLSPWDAPLDDYRFASFFVLFVMLCASPLMLFGIASSFFGTAERGRHRISCRAVSEKQWNSAPGILGEVLLAFVLVIGILLLSSDQSPDFIYFQF